MEFLSSVQHDVSIGRAAKKWVEHKKFYIYKQVLFYLLYELERPLLTRKVDLIKE